MVSWPLPAVLSPSPLPSVSAGHKIRHASLRRPPGGRGSGPRRCRTPWSWSYPRSGRSAPLAPTRPSTYTWLPQGNIGLGRVRRRGPIAETPGALGQGARGLIRLPTCPTFLGSSRSRARGEGHGPLSVPPDKPVARLSVDHGLSDFDLPGRRQANRWVAAHRCYPRGARRSRK